MLIDQRDAQHSTSTTPADVLGKSLQNLIRLLFLSYVLAWLLSNTSSYPLLNWPVALLLLLGAKWLAAYIDQHAKPAAASASSKPPPFLDWRSPSFIPHVRPSDVDRDSWRVAVNSKIVEFAWEKFCNSILQEWVYDAWYAHLTPDREFPAEIRQLLNTVFGELCIRSRRVDVRTTLIKDVSDIIIENLQLYRQTVEAIGPGHFQNMTFAAKESAFQSQLKSDDKLHAALQSPEGHYKVLRGLSEGVVSLVLPQQERDLAISRSVVRELLAACVLRPVMSYFTPYSINQLFLAMFPEEVAGGARPGGSSSRVHFEGSQDFEKRAQQSAALERLDYQEQQAALGMESSSRKLPTTSSSLGSTEHAPVPPWVRLGMQAYKRTAHLRSRSWDDGILPTSHALHSTFDSSIMSTMDGSHDEGVRSDGEPRTFRHGGGHRSFASRTDILSSQPMSSSRAFTPDPGGPPSLPGSPAAAAAAAPAAAGPLQPEPPPSSNSPQPSPQSSPTKASQPSSAATTPTLSQGQQAGAAAPAPGRPAFDAIAELTAASLLQQHQSQQEQPAPKGQLQAVILAAQTFNDGSKDFVLYQIQVCEGDSMWSVSRRYRNFEALHKRLREVALYREAGLALPPKRLMVHTNDKSFMMKRGKELQEYLDALLQDPRLGRCEEVLKFLSSVNTIYSADDSGGLFKSLTSNMAMAKRAVGGVLDEGRERMTFLSSSMRDSTRRIGGLGPRLRAAASTSVKSAAPSLPPMSPPPRSAALPQLSEPRAPSPFGLSPPEQLPPVVAVQATSGEASAASMRSQGTGAESPPPVITRAPPAAAAGSSMASQDAAARQVLQASGVDPGEGGSKRNSGQEAGGLDEYLECTGISAPLYSMVVAVFELQGRGFFRRQVVTLATQMLSLVAGDAIDSYLGDQLKSLSSEPNIARWISTLQSSLWPGGVWYSVTPSAAARPAHAGVPTTTPAPHTLPPSLKPPAGKDAKVGKAVQHPAAVAVPASAAPAADVLHKAAFVQAETYMEPHTKPTDEAEVAEKVKAKLFAAAPAALVRLVGQKCYSKSMHDVYEMLQSPTFTYQIGYRTLETLAMALFPELRES